MKWAKRIGLGVAVLVLVVLVIVYLSLNSIVRAVIERQSTASLGVTTTLGSANLSPFGGTVGLNDLEVASPPGFSAPRTFTLGGVGISVSYGQLRNNPIHINKITIDNPVLFVEQNNLKLNLQALMDQMPQTPKAGSGQPTEPMKLIIDELNVNNAHVNFMPGLPGLGAQIPIAIPSMTLTSVGNADGNQNGVAIKQVVLQVATALASKAADSANLPPELKLLLSGSLGNISQQLGNAAGTLSKQLPAEIGNLIGGKGGTNGNDASDQASKAIKGLFGNDKK